MAFSLAIALVYLTTAVDDLLADLVASRPRPAGGLRRRGGGPDGAAYRRAGGRDPGRAASAGDGHRRTLLAASPGSAASGGAGRLRRPDRGRGTDDGSRGPGVLRAGPPDACCGSLPTLRVDRVVRWAALAGTRRARRRFASPDGWADRGDRAFGRSIPLRRGFGVRPRSRSTCASNPGAWSASSGPMRRASRRCAWWRRGSRLASSAGDWKGPSGWTASRRSTLRPHELAQRCGLLFQNAATQLSNTTATVFEEVGFGPSNLGLARRRGRRAGRLGSRRGGDREAGGARSGPSLRGRGAARGARLGAGSAAPVPDPRRADERARPGGNEPRGRRAGPGGRRDRGGDPARRSTRPTSWQRIADEVVVLERGAVALAGPGGADPRRSAAGGAGRGAAGARPART